MKSRFKSSSMTLFVLQFLLLFFDRVSTLTSSNLEFSSQSNPNVNPGEKVDLSRRNISSLMANASYFREMVNKAFSPSATGLKTLEMSFNELSHLPDDLFCPLTSLNILNLTHNRLTGFQSLGVVDQKSGHLCLQELQELDLSYNRISFLSETGVASLKNLRALFLQHNLISRVAELSLSALSKLSVIDLSHNHLQELNPKTFRDSTELRQLHLQNNSLTRLPPELFKSLSKLLILNLSFNGIKSDHLTRETFLDLIRLVVLDLSNNQLERINGSFLESLYSLQVLNLSDNQISEVADNSFASLYNLDTLILTRNKLKTIGPSTLNGLYVLKKLSLTENDMTSIHDKAFFNCSQLNQLQLDENFLVEVPTSVSNLKLLRKLGLRHNLIQDVKNAPFVRLPHLEALDLSLNKIINLTRGSLSELVDLKKLDISFNNLRMLEHGVFDDAPALQSIHLEGNLLTDINGLFMNLQSLRLLNISMNRLKWFDYALIPKDLTHLDLHGNSIDELGNYFELSNLLSLKWMDVSSNALVKIVANSIPNNIEFLNATNNKIATIHQFSFMNKPYLKLVDLKNNSLNLLDLGAFQLEPVLAKQKLPEFFISSNPFNCDCNMEWLQRANTEYIRSGRYPRISDLDNVQCALKDSAKVPILQVNSSQFLCNYKSHCFALCHCCDFDACDCKMNCPTGCNCYYDGTWSNNIVDCSARPGRVHKAIPAGVPMDVSELYLDSNDLHTLSSHAFIGRRYLRVIYLNNSGIHVISNRTFNGLKKLEVLNLKYNQLTALHGYEFEQLTDLKELYLSWNRISTISNITFVHLHSLQILHLDHNHIFEFQVWNLKLNTRMNSLRLSHNTWSCECHFVEPFIQMLKFSKKIISDSSDVKCYMNGTTGLRLFSPDFNMSSCSTSQFAPSDESKVVAPQTPQDILPVVAVTGALVIVVLILLVCVICMIINRREVSVWFYSKYGVRLQGRAAAREEEKLFDCFVSYSKKDQVFVNQVLAPELEYGYPPFRLCLHYRDLPVASGYISDAIVEAMEASRRSILLISENFLKGEWCQYEFKSAHLEALRSNQRHKIILIFIGNINTKDFDPDIRFWLKTATVLQWGEKMFWEKLRYAMPDVAHSRKSYPEQTRDMTIAVQI